MYDVSYLQMVIEVSKKYLPKMACSFDNPRLHLHIQDGFEFMAKHEKTYDVIITDSSDPIGLYFYLIMLTVNRVYFRDRSSVNDLLKSEMTDCFNLKSVSDL